MRILSDDELPQWERDRRAALRVEIEHLRLHVQNTWKDVQPELLRCVREGKYPAEQELRQRAAEKTERIMREIAELERELPPHVELVEHGWLVRRRAGAR